MSKPSVLALSTFPVRFPRDGGQLRAAATRRFLTDHGWRVHSLNVCTDSFSKLEHDQLTFAVPAQHLAQQGFPWVVWDVALGREAVKPSALSRQIGAAIYKVQPDVVLLEQPWLLPVAQHFCPGVPTVYSSYNVEYRLKEVNLRLTKTDDSLRWIETVRQLEIEANEYCVAVAAVSQTDADWARSNGAKLVVVAPNGTHRRHSTLQSLNDWKKAFADRSYGVFVASAHPPNAEGFWEMLAPSLGFLNPCQVMVAVGSVGEHIQAHRSFRQQRSVNNARLIVAGFQPEAAIAAIITNAACVMLPITEGEGSNLKTAEALVSGRPIVGTTKAFRGFEQFAGQPGVVIADKPEDFRSAIREMVSTNSAAVNRSRCDSLLWDNALAPLHHLLNGAYAK